jgi:hypothetical protein
MFSSMEKAGMEGEFGPEHFGNLPIGMNDPAEHESIIKRTLLEGLRKKKLNDLEAGIAGLMTADLESVNHALGLVGTADIEQLIWIESSPAAQAKTMGLLQEIILAQDVAAKTNAAKELYGLME